jgi:glucose/arabinose dehydrogenase
MRIGSRLNRIALLFFVLFIPATIRLQAQTGAPATPLKDLKIDLKQAATGFLLPTVITNAGDGSGRMFIVQKKGLISILKNGQKAGQPFLDITSLVNSDANERGLLGLAFHPKYKNNGQFYVYYTAEDGRIVVAGYKVSSNPDVADPNSGKTLLTVPHPRSNHNGGQLAFGPDGFLYMGLGDGGGGGDPDRNGQNPNTLLAKILRIDVDKGDPYGIPDSNPFADRKAGRPEVWTMGMRNPWRFSFDRATGDLYIGDVGQDMYEEIDVQKAGSPGALNYGWNIMEALHCYPDASQQCNTTGFVLPVAEYSHSLGCSVTGGYVYRGKQYPRLVGTYFYGDYCSGRLWGLQPTADGKWNSAELLKSSAQISTFGEDEAGEVYAADLTTGTIFQLVDAAG